MASRKRKKAKKARKKTRARASKKRSSTARRSAFRRPLSGRKSNVERFVDRMAKSHTLKRYVVIAVKLWQGSRGPMFTYVGTASSAKEGGEVARDKSTRTEFILFDRTKKTWQQTTIPRAYVFRARD